MTAHDARRAAHEVDRRIFRGALASSVISHVALFLLAGGVIRSSATALQIPEGFSVDLIEIPEVIDHVKTPVEGVRQKIGDIPLPRSERQPRTKPLAARTPRRPDDPKRSKIDTVKTPPPVVTTNAKGAGGRLETDVEFDFGYYTEQITRRVMQNWAPTPGARDSSRTTVTFTILRDGTVTRVATLTTSGDFPFDRDAVIAVEAVGRFAPLPAGFRHDQLRVRFHFLYRQGV